MRITRISYSGSRSHIQAAGLRQPVRDHFDRVWNAEDVIGRSSYSRSEELL
jgi:hypothetical protein